MDYLIEDVFSPRSLPLNTYISRKIGGKETIDERLKRALAMKGNLIFISGASKSGKTVLCHKVINSDKYIELSGNQIDSKENFWSHIAEQIPLADSVVTTSLEERKNTDTGSLSAAINLGVMSFKAASTTGAGTGTGTQTAATNIRTQRQIVRYLIENNKVLVIDDFHYTAKDIQMYIARTLKTELFNGLKAVIISLPHRSDEAVICNPDLIGRTTSIDIPPWNKEELKEIAVKGFALLGLSIENSEIELLARESITSPQLMQDNCFYLAFAAAAKNIKIDANLVCSAFRETARNYAHYERIVKNISLGPVQGRVRRKLYSLQNTKEENSQKDIYNLLLLALKAEPPMTELSIADLKNRTSTILKEDITITSSLISSTINKIIKIVKDIMPDLDALEYENQCLYILDPFLLFYLRWKN